MVGVVCFFVIILILFVIFLFINYWYIIFPILSVIGIISLAFYLLHKKSKTKQIKLDNLKKEKTDEEKQRKKQEIKNSEEFSASLESAKRIICLLQIKGSDSSLMPSRYKYSYRDMNENSELQKEAWALHDEDGLIYFHIKKDYINYRDLSEIFIYNNPGVDKDKLDALIAIKWFEFADVSNITDFISIYDFVQMVTHGKITPCSRGSYSLEYTYSMPSPCGLKGENREYFLEELEEAYFKHD